jgi:putative transposase
MPVELRSEDQALVSKDVIVSDPGIRTSMTGYSPRCELLQVAKGDAVRIYHVAYALDRLYSKWSQQGVKHEKRWQIRKAGARASAKIRQLVQDLHEKLAKFLCTNFYIILLPKFQTSTIMIRRRKRKLKLELREH